MICLTKNLLSGRPWLFLKIKQIDFSHMATGH
ncbi:hypothetical protein X474_08535 [Dethiosulfatarculus sandiegensis]|uniref:Uncharacterized protein n=1 Tax=Dethiosulfatarculus sandiegensis TaxID=1429043 RepID=A0A0D2JG32_9BACT|nr:hypothetical protein X474_08535 [Dethiosulfatarculus sandiegensis]